MFIEEKILRASDWLMNAHQAIAFGATFVWLLAFYILYQLYRKKFLLWLIWGEIIGIIDWFYTKRHSFFGAPEQSTNPLWDMALILTGQLISFCSLIVTTVGAVMALNFLQKKFKEAESRRQSQGEQNKD